MMAAISAAAARAGESAFGRLCGKICDAIDCAIPLMVGAALIVGMAFVTFGIIN